MTERWGGAVTSAVCVAMSLQLAGCAPEVGSPRWCEAMRDKARGDWTANEALDFTRHCLFGSEDGDAE